MKHRPYISHGELKKGGQQRREREREIKDQQRCAHTT